MQYQATPNTSFCTLQRALKIYWVKNYNKIKSTESLVDDSVEKWIKAVSSGFIEKASIHQKMPTLLNKNTC